MAVQTASLVISAEDKASAALAKVGKAFESLDKAARATKGVDEMGQRIRKMQQALVAVEKVKKAEDALASAGMAAKMAGARIAEMSKALDGAKKAGAAADQVKQLTAALRQEQMALRGVETALARKEGALNAAKAALRGFGAPVTSLTAHENALRASINQTTAAMERQARAAAAQTARVEALARAEKNLAAGMGQSGRRTMDGLAISRGMSASGRAAHDARIAALDAAADRAARRREERVGALKVIGSGAGVYAAHKGRGLGLDAIQSAADFDIATRKQKVFLDLSGDEQKGLLEQAKRIGQETQFSNIDVVKAQTAAMQGLPASFAPGLKAEIAKGILDNVRNFSTLLETDLQDGSEIIRSYLQQTGKDISTKEKAIAEANKATNQLVKMAKVGGMSGEDVSQYVKFAASPGTAAGLSPETLMSLAALARRGGLRGDEAGTFIRTAASKMVSPTAPGIAALNAAGIRFSDYVSMPDKLSTSALEGQFQNKLGKGFTPEIRKRLDAINSDKSLIQDRGRYTEAVVGAVGGVLGKNKDGTVRASDARVAAKTVGDFHKVSAQSVDTERLLNDAMSKGMTLAQLNAWLTDKHGGKGAITQRQWDEFRIAREQISKAGDDPDWAKKRADEVFAGLGGAVENLKGSFENLKLTIGNANAELIKLTADTLGKGMDAFSNLSPGQQQALSLLGFGGAAVGGAAGSFGLAKALLGMGGGAELKASAVALDGSAAALTLAAGKLGASGLPGGGKLGLLGSLGLPALGTLGVGYMLSQYGDPSKSVNGTGGRPDFGMNPGDELPGVSGSTDRPSWTRRGSLPPGTAGMPGPAVPRLPGLDGRPSRGFQGRMRPLPALTIPTDRIGGSGARGSEASDIDEVTTKAGRAKAVLDAITGVDVTPKADASVFDPLIAKAKELIGLLRILTGEADTAASAASSAARTSFSDS